MRLIRFSKAEFSLIESKISYDKEKLMYAFISYAYEDRKTANKVKECLKKSGINSFMAHDDINVSSEWARNILEEIKKADIFISLWSKNYLKSPWCLQESGIAVFREDMTEIPLSIDQKSIPLGAASYLQAKKVNPDNITIDNLLPGLIQHNVHIGMEHIISSNSFMEADRNFELTYQYLEGLEEDEIIKFLEKISKNNQVYNAWECIKKYIPPLFEKYEARLSKKAREILRKAIEEHKQ